jgi:hypothetical protein
LGLLAILSCRVLLLRFSEKADSHLSGYCRSTRLYLLGLNSSSVFRRSNVVSPSCSRSFPSMFAPRNCRIRPFTILQHQPWPMSPATASRLNLSHPVEEGITPCYHPDRFYPPQLGQVLHERYQIATKLGYGSSSTVWLARDLHRLFTPSFTFWLALITCSWRWLKEWYVAIKINANRHHSHQDATVTELAMLRHISQNNPQHEGWHFVRIARRLLYCRQYKQKACLSCFRTST